MAMQPKNTREHILSLYGHISGVGSSEKSQHARGQAADFECHSVDNKELFDWVTNNLDYDQAILEFYTGSPESGWLHVSYNKDGNRKQRLRAFRNDAGKTQYEEI
jgi:hypothetical protein